MPIITTCVCTWYIILIIYKILSFLPDKRSWYFHIKCSVAICDLHTWKEFKLFSSIINEFRKKNY